MSSYTTKYVSDTEMLAMLGLEASGEEGTRARTEALLYLELAEAAVDKFCGCSLAAASPDSAVQRQFDGPGIRSLSLPPVRSITAVGLGFPTPTTLVVSGNQRQVWQYPDVNDPVHGGAVRRLELSSGVRWTRGRQNVWVTGKWGYSTIPVDVRGAVHSMVKRRMDRRDIPDGVASESLAGGSVQYDTAHQPKIITQAEEDLLAPFAVRQLYSS